jgi:hypothetical protein
VSAIFERDGDFLVPSVHARGPWAETDMHGGGPTALLARAIEALEPPAPMQVVRLAVEFPGAVPMAPVRPRARLTRAGRRLALAEAVLEDEAGGVVLRAGATLLRRGEVALPAAALAQDARTLRAPADSEPAQWQGGDETAGFHLTGVDIRFAEGDWDRGPAAGWFRFAMPLVAGEEPTPVQRAVAFADFGNGLSRALDFRTHLFVNTDLTVHLHREAQGEWIALDARTDLSTTGVGQATSVLRDERGRIGVGAQSLYVAER